MEILLSFTASFSVMERRLSKLISDVSNIKGKQDNLQYSLDCLQSRKSDGEHQRGFLPSPERPSWLRQRNSSSSSTSSMPVKRKPSAAWYATDSFSEQFSPPFHGHSLAQPSFELAYPSHSNTQPSDHLLTPLQPREILGKSAKPMEKGVVRQYQLSEQFSPPFHGRSLAQPSFELAYPSHSLTQPSDHLLTPLQPRKILGKSAKPEEKGVVRQYQLSAVQQKQHKATIAVEPKPMDKESRVSAGPCQQHHLQMDTQQADTLNPKHTSKSAPVDGSGVLSIPLASDVIMKIRYVSSSRRNFSANLNRKIFTVAERKSAMSMEFSARANLIQTK